MDWITKVRDGDFGAIPANIDFANSGGLADLVDGFDVAGDEQRASEIHSRVRRELCRPGIVGATALDLLIANHYAHYACRVSGHMPTGEEAVPYDRLARELRAALVRLTPKQKAGMLAAFVDGDEILADGER